MKNFMIKHQVWAYGLMTILLSSLLYCIVIFSKLPFMSFPIGILTLISGLMPLIMAIFFAKINHESISDFIKTSFNLKQVNKNYFIYLLIYLFILTFVPVLLTNITFKTSIWFSKEISLFIPIGFIFGALEEPGWRGFMQKRIDLFLHPLIGSLIIGVFWMFWHTPLFFINNTYQHGLGLLTTEFWIFNLSLIIAAPLYAYLFHITNQNVLFVVIFHGLSNVLREIFYRPNPYFAFAIEVFLMCFVIIVGRNYFFKKKTILSEI